MKENKPATTPYFDNDGDIVIPFHTEEQYKWWCGGQSVSETIEILRENDFTGKLATG